MHSVAIIEDEEHKSILFAKLVNEELGSSQVDISQIHFLRQAVSAVRRSDFNLILLDVSLPIYPSDDEFGSFGHAQQINGGIEVVRSMGRLSRAGKIVVISQHPNFLVNGEKINLHEAPKFLGDRYRVNVVAGIQYYSDDIECETQIRQAIRLSR